MNRALVVWLCVLLVSPVQAGSADRCPQARDPARCVARSRHRMSVGLTRPGTAAVFARSSAPPDCSASEDPSRCEQRQQARAVCKGKSGKAWRACLNEQEAR